MIRFLMLMLSVVFSFQVFASGPSYSTSVQDVNGYADGKTEWETCDAAKSGAVVPQTSGNAYVVDFRCELNDEDIIESRCACAGTDTGFTCTYDAKITCYETVWYP